MYVTYAIFNNKLILVNWMKISIGLYDWTHSWISCHTYIIWMFIENNDMHDHLLCAENVKIILLLIYHNGICSILIVTSNVLWVWIRHNKVNSMLIALWSFGIKKDGLEFVCGLYWQATAGTRRRSSAIARLIAICNDIIQFGANLMATLLYVMDLMAYSKYTYEIHVYFHGMRFYCEFVLVWIAIYIFDYDLIIQLRCCIKNAHFKKVRTTFKLIHIYCQIINVNLCDWHCCILFFQLCLCAVIITYPLESNDHTKIFAASLIQRHS